MSTLSTLRKICQKLADIFLLRKHQVFVFINVCNMCQKQRKSDKLRLHIRLQQMTR